MSGFTPGPWEIGYDAQEVIAANGRGSICMVLGNVAEGPRNADLIAAAPELYASLAGLIIALNSGGPFPHESIDRATAALRKARGEQA